MDREEFVKYLKAGVAKYFYCNDVMVQFDDIDDMCEHITDEIDHAMMSFDAGIDTGFAS